MILTLFSQDPTTLLYNLDLDKLMNELIKVIIVLMIYIISFF